MKSALTAATLSLALFASHASAQESPPAEVDASALMKDFDFAKAEKINCDPNSDKTPCIVGAWEIALATGKPVVAYHMAPAKPTMNIVFPAGVVVQLQPAAQGQAVDFPPPAPGV